ncbi:MAG: fumarylacetoacetate hydrolase family protein [Actinobacteria bacterium]|nr:fumarylacetoacetate hydrolase family protein [Actinomycetota bacterium]
MRLYRYTSNRGGWQPRIAISIDDRRPVDLVEAWSNSKGDAFDFELDRWLTSTLLLIEEGAAIWHEVEQVVRETRVEPLDVRSEAVTWLCPLDRMASLKDFLAFEDHVKRGARRRGGEVPGYWYEAPIYYKGNHRALLGPEDECPWPAYTEQMDFELELAMIVGKRGRDVAPEAASDHIFGFTVFNDFSARDVQAQEISAWLGPAKGKDFANAFGPCIVTADELGAEPDLLMTCRVNGEVWGRGRSGDARWTWTDMVAHVSQAEDIWPGDVFGSGTPGGCCGLDLGRQLEAGDVVELEIEGIGTLRNAVGSRPVPSDDPSGS